MSEPKRVGPPRKSLEEKAEDRRREAQRIAAASPVSESEPRRDCQKSYFANAECACPKCKPPVPDAPAGGEEPSEFAETELQNIMRVGDSLTRKLSAALLRERETIRRKQEDVATLGEAFNTERAARLVAETRAAKLARYVTHVSMCGVRHAGADCTCGLDAALASTPEGKRVQ